MSLLDALLGDKGLVVRFKADLSDFEAGLAKAKTNLTSWRDQTNESTKDMAKWGAAVTATVAPIIALGTAVYSMQQKYGAMADQIGDLSYTTGLSTEKIQQLQYAAVLSNDSFSTIAMGINYLTLSMSKATDATSEQAKAFASLGVSTVGKSPDQVFEETTNALIGMKDETRRNEIAMALYGRSWKEMLPFMEDYIKNKEKIQSTPTFSKQELQDLQDAKKAWDDLGNSITIYTGKALLSVQSSFSKDAIDSVHTLDRAYRKLFTGDIKGYLDEATAYHDKLAREEADKITANAAGGAPSLSGITGTTVPLTAAGEDSMKAAVDTMTDAMRDYKNALEDVADAQQKLNDINKEYTRDLQTLDPRDVQGFINLRMRHNWAAEDQTAALGKAQSGVEKTSFEGQIASDMSSKLVISINTLNLNGDKSFEKTIQEQRIRAGVR